MKPQDTKVTFKSYTPLQLLFPAHVRDLMPQKQMVSVVNYVVNDPDL